MIKLKFLYILSSGFTLVFVNQMQTLWQNLLFLFKKTMFKPIFAFETQLILPEKN